MSVAVFSLKASQHIAIPHSSALLPQCLQTTFLIVRTLSILPSIKFTFWLKCQMEGASLSLERSFGFSVGKLSGNRCPAWGFLLVIPKTTSDASLSLQLPIIFCYCYRPYDLSYFPLCAKPFSLQLICVGFLMPGKSS